MSSIAYRQPDGQLVPGEDVAKPVRDKIKQAREHRRKFEPDWNLSLAYALGKHWTVIHNKSRQLRSIQQVDPRYANKELYSADVINEYRMLALGELGSNDDRPELLLQRDDGASEDFQESLNKRLAFGWDYEFDGDEILAEADRLCVDLGTSAIRCRFDPTVGPDRDEGEIPHVKGLPVFGDDARRAAAAAVQAGEQLEYRTIPEGRVSWEALSAFNILVPPGITHERRLPWECIVRPTLLSDLRAEFGDVVDGLPEDANIGSTLGSEVQTGNSVDGTSYAIGEGRDTRLQGHAWLFTYFEKPSQRHRQGRVLYFGGNEMRLLRIEDKLPYARLDEKGRPVEWRSGLVFFHWWRATGRFWARGLVEALREGQFQLNRLGTDVATIIERGKAYVIAEEGPMATALKKTNEPLEVVRVPQGTRAPQPVQGIGPGAWMAEARQKYLEDIERAAGIRSPSLGENPTNVDTYSQLAQLSQADQVKRSPMQRERKMAIKQLVEDTVYDFRTYDGEGKQVALAGDEDRIETAVFNGTKIPPFFIVRVAKGAAKPRDQVAELKKVEQLWQAALASGAVTKRPGEWITWYYESLEAGEALSLPEDSTDDQFEKAEAENHMLLLGQEDVPVAYYDPADVHIPRHRRAQIQAELTDMQAWTRLEDHIQEHLAIAKQLLEQQAAQQAGMPPPDMPPDEGQPASEEAPL